MIRIFLFIAALLGGLSVATGAFAAHALRERLTERSLEIFETAVRYQMYHALALLGVALLLIRAESTALIVAGWAFIVGITLFSGSLYTLSLSNITILGAVAPLGGVGLIIGWAAIAIAAFNFK